jgi:formylglycine-generating enzyme required for sulfatase activity
MRARSLVLGALFFATAAVSHPKRHLLPGSVGTIEHAIASYHPKYVRAVDEGTLPNSRPGATCPSEMASVEERFCVDRWEGTLLEVTSDGTTRTHTPYEPPEDGKTYRARSASGAVPQAHVSAAQAQDACKAVGKRLCQPIEWRAACGGNEGYAYSYGPARVAGKCNDNGRPPMQILHPPSGPKWPGWSLVELNDARANQLESTVVKTGDLAGCVNDLGVHDMVGNLHEWTADPNGTFQGGYYLDVTVNGEGCAYRTTAHHFQYHDYSTGFRCCRDTL